MFDVSVVVTFHNEKLLASPTLASIRRMRSVAMQKGITNELVIVLDRACVETKQTVRRQTCDDSTVNILEVDNGDLGLSRNDGLDAARGEIICIVDGDDLYSPNWIERTVTCLRDYGTRAVVHPELAISFGAKYEVFRMIDQSDPAYDPAALFTINYWCSWVSGFRDTFLSVPYGATGNTGFGYEDWHWNCAIIVAGFEHRIAPGVAGFYRRKEAGLCALHQQQSAIIRKTEIFSGRFITG